MHVNPGVCVKESVHVYYNNMYTGRFTKRANPHGYGLNGAVIRIPNF